MATTDLLTLDEALARLRELIANEAADPPPQGSIFERYGLMFEQSAAAAVAKHLHAVTVITVTNPYDKGCA